MGCTVPPPQIHMLKSEPLGPQNVTVLGDGAFTEAVKAQQGCWGGPNRLTGVLTGRGDWDTQH